MRFAVPITVALVVLTICVAPITAQQTTTECGTTMGDGTMNGTTRMMNGTTTQTMGNESMDNGSMTTMMGNETMMTTTRMMDNETMGNESMNSMDATTTRMMGNESMDNESTTESMAGETTTCANDGMGDGMDATSEMDDDSMSDTATESMNDQSMNDATETPDSGASAFAPGFGVAAAVVALLGALLLARR